MRRNVCLFAVLFVLPVLGSDAPKDYDGATEAVGVEGTWEMVSTWQEGRQVGPIRGPCVQINRGGRWTYREGGRLSSEGVYTYDARRTPPTLDETMTVDGQAGHTRKSIYRLEGDTLRTACWLDGRGRPKSFDEDGLFIIVWKRVQH
jgi:uncharacterized protein (TIGR03067 family)